MAVSDHTYDLVLVLDPQAEEATRAKIVADARAAIEAQGELLRQDEWGERPLAYPIARHKTGEYHLFQFRPATAELLSGLDRSLRIADQALRFRIVKLKAGTPAAPDMSTHAAAAVASAPASAPAYREQAADAEPQPAAAVAAADGGESA